MEDRFNLPTKCAQTSAFIKAQHTLQRPGKVQSGEQNAGLSIIIYHTETLQMFFPDFLF